MYFQKIHFEYKLFSGLYMTFKLVLVLFPFVLFRDKTLITALSLKKQTPQNKINLPANLAPVKASSNPEMFRCISSLQWDLKGKYKQYQCAGFKWKTLVVLVLFPP